MKRNLWFWLIILFTSLESKAGFGFQSTEEAYVTLLYGDEFLLGVRVLGKSIRDTGSKRDMVALVSDGVSDYAKKLISADGWIVTKITLLANPNQVRPKRFWGVYTKLKIFNMTNYKKVVYLDADTIVIKDIEDLFKCAKFCANLKHSERLNSGVMVVEPSETVFEDMMSKVSTLHSYTGGDQGFLNSYYPEFPNAHVFEPNLPPEILNSREVPKMERLSTLYNADVGLYMLANKWMVDESQLRVIHYTLGPLKPWDWWTAWLLKPVDVWQNVRAQLEESLPGTGGGRNPHDDILVKFLFLLPLCMFLFCFYHSFLQALQIRDLLGSLCRNSFLDHVRHIYYKMRSSAAFYSCVSNSNNSPRNRLSNGAQCKVPAYLGGISVCFCFMAAVVSVIVSLLIVPRQVMPWTGLLLMYEWTFTMFIVIFGVYVRLIRQWGKITTSQAGFSFSNSESSDYESRKGHQQQTSGYVSPWYYGLGIAFLAIAAPALPAMLGITALFPRLGLMVVGGIILASFMTFASEHLAIGAFLKGLEDTKAPTRGRKLCLVC